MKIKCGIVVQDLCEECTCYVVIKITHRQEVEELKDRSDLICVGSKEVFIRVHTQEVEGLEEISDL